MHIPGRLGQVAQQRALSNGHSLTILLQPQVNSTVPPIHQSPHPHVGAAAARRLPSHRCSYAAYTAFSQPRRPPNRRSRFGEHRLPSLASAPTTGASSLVLVVLLLEELLGLPLVSIIKPAPQAQRAQRLHHRASKEPGGEGGT